MKMLPWFLDEIYRKVFLIFGNISLTERATEAKNTYTEAVFIVNTCKVRQ